MVCQQLPSGPHFEFVSASLVHYSTGRGPMVPLTNHTDESNGADFEAGEALGDGRFTAQGCTNDHLQFLPPEPELELARSENVPVWIQIGNLE